MEDCEVPPWIPMSLDGSCCVFQMVTTSRLVKLVIHEESQPRLHLQETWVDEVPAWDLGWEEWQGHLGSVCSWWHHR